jgi:MFS family permease
MAGFHSLRVLGRRDFRVYWLGQSVSLIGTWMQQMAQAWVVMRLSQNALSLGLLMLVGSLPVLLLGLHAGQIADRFDKRKILIATQIAMMALAFAFSALAFGGELRLWHVYTLAVLLGVVTAFDLPAAQAFAPELVDRSEIPHAVALMQSTFHGSRLIGPAIAGVLIARYGEGSAFLVNGLSFAAVIGSLMIIASRPVAASAARGTGGLGGGFRYVQQDALMRALLLLAIACLAFAFPFVIILMPYYARHVLGADAATLGGIMSGSGLGALIGASSLLVMPFSSWRMRLWAGGAGATAALVALGINHSLGLATLLSAALSLGTSLVMGTLVQVVQLRVPSELRGRVMALFGMAFTGVLPAAGLLLSLSADAVGLRTLMFGCAGAFLILVALILSRMPRDA